MKLSKLIDKRFISIPSNRSRPLFFNGLEDLKEYFSVKNEVVQRAFNDGFPICVGNVAYYIDEDLFE